MEDAILAEKKFINLSMNHLEIHNPPIESCPICFLLKYVSVVTQGKH